mgnify:CR=1 FL=1
MVNQANDGDFVRAGVDLRDGTVIAVIAVFGNEPVVHVRPCYSGTSLRCKPEDLAGKVCARKTSACPGSSSSTQYAI